MRVFEDLNGNRVADGGEPQTFAEVAIQGPPEGALYGALDLRESAALDRLYTSQTQALVLTTGLGPEDLHSGGLMSLSDRPIAGRGYFVPNRVPLSDLETSASLGLWGVPALGSGASLARTTETAAQGQWALTVSGAAEDAIVTQDDDTTATGHTGLIAIESGTLYTFSFQHRAATAGDGVRLTLLERDATGALVRRTTDFHTHQSPGQWTRSEFTFRTAGQSETLGIEFKLSGDGTPQVWLDALQLERGSAATSWKAGPGDAGTCQPVNLLANPSLTLDDGTTWSLWFPGLTGAMDTTPVNGQPGGWALTTGRTPAITTVTLPAMLAERGLTQMLELSGSGTFELEQALIEAPAEMALHLSVYASGDGELELAIDSYDAAQQLIATDASTFTLTGSIARYGAALEMAEGASSIAARIGGNGSAAAQLAAAQCVPGSVMTSWVGWVPYAESVEGWRLDADPAEGEKRVEVQLMDSTGRLSRRPARRLTLDTAGNGGLLEGLGGGTYEATAETGASVRTISARSLFDGNAATWPATGAVDRLTVSWTLVARPEADSLVLTFAEAPVSTTTAMLRGGFEPGEWLTTETLALTALNPVDGTLRFESLDWQYRVYELTIASSQTQTVKLNEVDLRGRVRPIRDNMIYDITAPDGAIIAPLTAATVGGASVDIAVATNDPLSGPRNARYRWTQAGGASEWVELEAGDGVGVWRASADISELEDGPTTLTVIAWDRAGNAGEPMRRALTIDRTAPVLSAPEFQNLTTGNAIWAKAGDHLRLSATVDDTTLSTGLLTADLTALGGASTVPASELLPPAGGEMVALWDLGLLSSSVSQGLASVQIDATDDLGNQATPVVAQITVDLTAPTLQVATPDHDPVTTESLTIMGTSDDSGSGVMALVGYELRGTEWSPAEYRSGQAAAVNGAFDEAIEAFTIELSELPDQQYTLNMWAIDAAGNVRTTMTLLTFTVDAQAASIDAALTNLTLESSEWLRDGQFLVLSADIEDVQIGTLSADLSPIGGGAAVSPAMYAAGQAWWYVPQANCAPADGLLTVQVDALDTTGRAAMGQASIQADNTTPTLTVTGIDAGVLVSSSLGFATSTTLTLEGVATDATPGEVWHVRHRLDGNSWTTSPLAGDPATTVGFQVPLSDLDEGTHLVELDGWDRAGNGGAAPYTTFTLIVDPTGPRLDRVDLYNETSQGREFVRDGDTLRLKAWLDAAAVNSSDTVTADLSALGGAMTVTPTTRTETVALWPISAVDTAPENGELTVVVTVVDGKGLSDSMATTITADNLAPASTIELAGANPTTNTLIQVTGEATDIEPGRVRRVEVRVVGDGGQTVSEWMAASSRDSVIDGGGFDSATEIYDFEIHRPAGDYVLQSRAIDRAGNVEPTTYPQVSVTVSTDTLTQIREAGMYNDLLNQLPPADRIYFRNGQPLTLWADTWDVLPTSTTLHADLSTFGAGSDLAPDETGIGNRRFLWRTTAALPTPVTAEVLGWVWTDAHTSSPTQVQMFADHTSPTLTLVTDQPTTFSSGMRIAGVAVDVGSRVREVQWRYDKTGETSHTWKIAFTDQNDDRTSRTFEIIGDPVTTGPVTVWIEAFDMAGNSDLTSTTIYIESATGDNQVGAGSGSGFTDNLWRALRDQRAPGVDRDGGQCPPRPNHGCMAPT